MRIGILGPSEIAKRRFLPSLFDTKDVSYCGVAINTPQERYGEELPTTEEVTKMLARQMDKATSMVKLFGGDIYSSFQEMIEDTSIDAVYIPLPPALHYKWTKAALLEGKHVLVEKPATTNSEDTKELIKIAKEKNLALHENYMFVFHNQLREISRIISSGELGEVRLIRVLFGFPQRAPDDFRYDRALGGGALLDAGGYTIRLASYFLGETAKIKYAQRNDIDSFEVDMYGSGALVNHKGATVQIAFGMDNEYKCELEIWGSKGNLETGRILTAPADFEPTARIVKGGKEETISLPPDDAFRKSIERFACCIIDKEIREDNYRALILQAELMQDFMNMAD